MLVAAALCSFALVFAGCDSTSNAVNPSASSGSASVTSTLPTASASANLPDDARQTLDAFTATLQNGRPQPGALWTLAADLHATLTPDQADVLIAELESLSSDPRVRSKRSPRGRHGEPGLHKRGHRGRHGDGPWSQLDLSDEQKEVIHATQDAYRDDIQALRDASDGRPDAETREQMRALRQEMRDEIRSTLSDEQVATLESMREARRARLAERRDDRQAARAKALQLTDEQQAALDELRDTWATQRDAMRERVRSGGERPTPEARTALRASHRAAVAAILTDDQTAIVELHRALALSLRGSMRGAPGPVHGRHGMR